MSDTADQEPRGFSRLSSLLQARKIDFGLWITRLLTLVFAFAYIVPVFGNNPYSSYSKCLMASAATSALR